jgi:4-hydroxythreonine-4-phosphate dehydrogenase
MPTIARLLVTPGEPAGIGPDLCCLAAQNATAYEWIAVGDPTLLRERAAKLGLDIDIVETYLDTTPNPNRSGQLKVLPIPAPVAVTPGQLDAGNADYVLATLTTAIAACQADQADAMVTGPVHKGVINQAGTAFSGHTEFIANLTGGHPVMMLATPELRVALATTHLPLREVPDAITTDLLVQVISIMHHDLRHRFGLQQPRITVCGLNPHAGEDGHLGREELQVIIPALTRLRAEGIELRGPLPADTAFVPTVMAASDAFLAMYHDQGLAVLKHVGFGHAVNVTLGLPIVRTSVDHGTALDRAGTGDVNLGSLNYAMQTAIIMLGATS